MIAQLKERLKTPDSNGAVNDFIPSSAASFHLPFQGYFRNPNL